MLQNISEYLLNLSKIPENITNVSIFILDALFILFHKAQRHSSTREEISADACRHRCPISQLRQPVTYVLNFNIVHLNQTPIAQNKLLIFLHFTLKRTKPPNRAWRFVTWSWLESYLFFFFPLWACTLSLSPCHKTGRVALLLKHLQKHLKLASLACTTARLCAGTPWR